jgi:hypothetical protein
VVLFNEQEQIVYVGSECEHRHGDAAIGAHEVGSKTCYQVVTAFQDLLRPLHKREVLGHTSMVVTDQTREILPPRLLNTLSYAYSKMQVKHNERVMDAMALRNAIRPLGKIEKMQLVVNRICQTVFNDDPQIDLGRNIGNISSSHLMTNATVMKRYKPPFTVEYDSLGPINAAAYGVSDLPQGTYITLLWHASGSPLAFRAKNGKWHIAEDRIKTLAPQMYVAPGNKPGSCYFCAGDFTRITKHTQGAGHVTEVLKAVKQITRATEPAGLKILTNPKHGWAVFNKKK